MGLILDSSILIAGERQGASVAQILRRVRASQGEIESALSVVTIVELTQGSIGPRTIRTVSEGRRFAMNSAAIWWCTP